MALDGACSALAAMSGVGDAELPRMVLRAYDVGEGGDCGEGGRGGLVVALGGRFDAAAADRLRGRCAELRHRAGVELVLECSALSTGCHVALARAVARLRLQARRAPHAGARTGRPVVRAGVLLHTREDGWALSMPVSTGEGGAVDDRWLALAAYRACPDAPSATALPGCCGWSSPP